MGEGRVWGGKDVEVMGGGYGGGNKGEWSGGGEWEGYRYQSDP